MRITGWHIDAFGVVRDAGVRDLPDGLVVVHGPNASGKTTLLAFLQRTLFGHPHRNRKDVNHYDLVVDGQRGGRVVCDADGEVVVERHVGRGGELKVVQADGTVGAEPELAALTGGCDDQLFNAVFAFGLDELRSMSSLDDEGVRDRLFSAGVRGAGRSARAVRDRLEADAKALWTPRSRTAEIDVLDQQLAEIDSELAEARRTAADYRRRLAAEQERREEVQRLTLERDEAGAAERRAALLLSAWPVWVRREQAAEELAAVADAPKLSDDALETLQSLTTQLDGCEKALAELDREFLEVVERHDSLEVDDALAGVAAEAQALDDERAAQRDRLERLRQLEAERERLEGEVTAVLTELGEGWDRARLEELDVSVPVRGEVRSWQDRLAEAERAVSEIDHRLRDAEVALQRARRRRERADAAVGAAAEDAPPPQRDQIDRGRSSVGNLRAALADRDKAAAELAAAERLAGSTAAASADRTAQLAFGLAGALAVVAGAAWAADSLAGAALLGLLAVAAVAGALRLRRDAGHGGQGAVGQAKAQLERAVAAVAGPAAALGLDGHATTHDVERAAAELERADRARTELDGLRAAAAGAADTLAEEQQAHEQVTTARDRAVAELEEARAGWAAWCGDTGFGTDRSPSTVVDLLAVVDRAHERRQRLVSVESDLAALRGSAAQYAHRAARALTAAGRDRASHEPGDLAPDEAASDAEAADPAIADVGAMERQLEAVGRLAVDTAEDARLRAERRHLHERSRAVEHRREQQRALRDEREKELGELLASGGAADVEGFREAVARARRRDTLAEQVRQADTDLGTRLGAGTEAEALREQLASGERTSWEAVQAEAKERRDQLDVERDTALQDLHRAEAEREQVETSERIVELDGRRETLLAQRDARTHEWRVTTVSRILVDTTLDQFERERQPEVLRRAGDHFSSVTDGTYAGVLQRGEELLVRDARDRLWPVAALSRGTAEQLYLCLRLSLAEDLAARQPRLPLVMDDVLVNFDPERARQVARLLAEVAKEGQVLYFTCHPHTVEMLEDTGAAAVYDLPRGGGTPAVRA